METDLHDVREKYKLGSFIQEGSSACVYAAVDVKTGNPVAVKLWKTRAYGNPSSARWLLRERDVHSTLRHPNIPRFIEPVQFVTGPEKVSRELLHGFAMEHVQDDDLYETLNAYKMIRKQVSGGRAASLICQLALLVDYLAQRELFHSDIKTENIVESYETGLVKLLDFGSAHSSRSVDGSLPGGLEETYFSLDDTYTAKPLSVFPFTLETAAPERFDDSAPDIRSELYSVGVVLYKILTFRYPIAVSRWALPHERRCIFIDRHKRLPVTPPNDHTEVATPLDDVCMKLLEKDPNDRYQSGQEVVEALEAAL